jgi:hypothetical protein
MPKHDGSGPTQKGPLTGRGGGYCVIPINTTAEVTGFLQNQERSLKKQLKHIKARINRTQTSGGISHA